jgi:hypothetical protein
MNQMIGPIMVMLPVIWGIDEFHVIDATPPGECFDVECFLPHIMDSLLAKVFPEGRQSHAQRMYVYFDNSRIHSSNALKQLLMKILLL